VRFSQLGWQLLVQDGASGPLNSLALSIQKLSMTKIVISYRRRDSEAITGRIRDCLADAYGPHSVFMDIDSIPIGVNFREYIADALRQTDLMLVIIGPHWLGDQARKAPIRNPTDPVRVELEKAFELGIPVWPVLVSNAVMPDPAKLPEPLKKFTDHNAAIVDAGRDFHPHMARLIREMNSRLGLAAKQQGGTSSRREQAADAQSAAPTGAPALPGSEAKTGRHKLPLVVFAVGLAAAIGVVATIAVVWLLQGRSEKSSSDSPRQNPAAVTTPNPPGALSCDQEKILRSLGSMAATSITFVNRTAQTRLVYWLDFAGNRVLYATLQSGRTVGLRTYITHPWVVTDATNNCIAIYMPTPNPQTINITR
jgi:hypothetical protein